MNDIILMAIKGGRYLEAEKQLNDILLNNPTSEDYFLMGSIKSNLILSKGRNLSEVLFCFEKCINLSVDKEQSNRDVGGFLFGIYKQLQGIDRQLQVEQKTQAVKTLAGLALTYFSSGIIDDSKNSFGAISGIVGASFGVGMSIDGLSTIGDLASQRIYLQNLKVEVEKYLKENYPELREKFYGSIDLNKLKGVLNQFPNEFYNFQDLSNEKIGLTKWNEYFNDLNFNIDKFLFGLKWHYQNYPALFYENYILAITNYVLGTKYVKLDYKDLLEVESDNKFQSYQPLLPTLLFSKAIEYDDKGNENEIENFKFGGKSLGRDMRLTLKKVKTGFFKNHDYTESRKYFNSCFMTSESSK